MINRRTPVTFPSVDARTHCHVGLRSGGLVNRETVIVIARGFSAGYRFAIRPSQTPTLKGIRRSSGEWPATRGAAAVGQLLRGESFDAEWARMLGSEAGTEQSGSMYLRSLRTPCGNNCCRKGSGEQPSALGRLTSPSSIDDPAEPTALGNVLLIFA